MLSAADTATAAGDGGVPCHVTLDPAADEIVTDAERLRQALINLLTNARQAAAQVSGGREPGRVDIDARAVEGHLVRLTIRDPGPGIAAEDLPRIFEPYFTTKRTGTGIGLAIARNIVEGLGGRITVRSRPGDGTEVVVDLPRTGPAAPPSPGPRA